MTARAVVCGQEATELWSTHLILRHDQGSRIAVVDALGPIAAWLLSLACMARYLVVDNDASAVWVLSRLLAADGHDVAAFTHGRDAVVALHQDEFDAIVTDLRCLASTAVRCF
jgi:PleD family two-component response regulator